MLDYADKALFDEQKVRFNLWKEEGFIGGDSELNDILVLFNKLPGVTTRYSCASHPENNDFQFYIQFVVTKEGFDILNTFFTVMRNNSIRLNKGLHRVAMFYLSIADDTVRKRLIPTAVVESYLTYFKKDIFLDFLSSELSLFVNKK